MKTSNNACHSLAVLLFAQGVIAATNTAMQQPLPLPANHAASPLTKIIIARRSVRAFTRAPVPLDQLGALLWAAQGITSPHGLRAAPSAGATYPLEVFVANARGVFHYRPIKNELVQLHTNDVRRALGAAALGQPCVTYAPAVVAFGAVCARTTTRYGERGLMYIHMEIGHATQNLMLKAVELGLGTVAVGAFDEQAAAAALQVHKDTRILYLVPVGTPAPETQ
jgi:SagB-type dehydrogenase family enzyme